MRTLVKDAISVIILCLLLYWVLNTEYRYDYIDWDGNTDNAEYCRSHSGDLYCRNGNHFFSVKEFTVELLEGK